MDALMLLSWALQPRFQALAGSSLCPVASRGRHWLTGMSLGPVSIPNQVPLQNPRCLLRQGPNFREDAPEKDQTECVQDTGSGDRDAHLTLLNPKLPMLLLAMVQAGMMHSESTFGQEHSLLGQPWGLAAPFQHRACKGH